jgi:transcription-repair coupling factor (superfamily II helicase)
MSATSKAFHRLLTVVERSQYFKSVGSLYQSQRQISIKNLSGSLRSVVASALWKSSNHTIVIVTQPEEANGWYHDMGILCGESQVTLCLPPDKRRKSITDHTAEDISSLLDVVSLLGNNERGIVIATPASFGLHLPRRESVVENLYTIKRGQVLSFDGFQQTLLLNGFERQDYVAKQGDIAVRGGIVDVYPVGWSTPIRIEFWGDEIESIREFDPLSQRSIREHNEVEFVARFYHEENEEFTANLTDFFDSNTRVFFDEPAVLSSLFYQQELTEVYENLSANFAVVNINDIGQADIAIQSDNQPVFESSVEELYHSLGEYQEKNYTIIISAEGAIHSRRIKELIENAGERFENENVDHYHVALNSIHWESATLNSGFICDELRIACFAEHQIFNRQRFRDTKKGGSSSGITLKELQQLRRGDLIVHIDKGVGKFDGLETISIGGSKQETVRLIFDGGDVLYVNLNYINKLQRYSAQDGTAPKLSKLGSSEWERKKARTKGKLKDIARDLIKLYALRKAQKGYSYPTDTVWQKEFEASFMYEDTPDQSRATAEVKEDMESYTPMDRLVCGDVGFGKTEVAIRAAFKAVQSGKQVAVLVPTTILAHQHHITFSERMKRYPMKVDVISRFRSTDEQKQIVDGIKAGGLDILIGTHRILSKDIQFKDLGLLIIDEEQRFGVGAKEKLRQMKANIDTLTLTATPIPRTLNFSLMGARDLSIMETPPRNRLPVETTIVEWDDDTLRDAILRETNRGGQIYFVNDSIQEIDALAMRITEIAPGIKFGIAHGQMESSKLETVMERFLERKFDILFATKIVESGLDIPNVNTIFINRADRFGLAELYQLRGRVGRSNTQAYCYLIVPPVKTLNKTAIRRLQAIEEHTDLGSGFHLAMRDLEIRGAGNLLGAEQSGFIAELGLETYQKILEEAVQELREEEFSTLFSGSKHVVDYSNDELNIELEEDALLPEDYVRKDTERFDYYKQLYNAKSPSKLSAITSELRDRYGVLPVQAENLLFAVRLRIAAMPTGFARIEVRSGRLICEVPVGLHQDYYQTVFPQIAATISTIAGARFYQHAKKTLVELPITSREEAVSVMEYLSRDVPRNVPADSRTSTIENSEME